MESTLEEKEESKVTLGFQAWVTGRIIVPLKETECRKGKPDGKKMVISWKHSSKRRCHGTTDTHMGGGQAQGSDKMLERKVDLRVRVQLKPCDQLHCPGAERWPRKEGQTPRPGKSPR